MTSGTKTPPPHALARAKRWARQAARERWQPGKTKCHRRMMDALYSALAPKRDGTHPLDRRDGDLFGSAKGDTHGGDINAIRR